MHERDAQAIAREFRSVYKRMDDQERRLSNVILQGPVAEVKGDMVRLELAPKDSRTGKAFLSPWVQVQEAAGQTGTHFPVKKGDPMRLLSPNGEIGAASIAIRDGYTQSAANPTDKKQAELIIAHDGPVRIKGATIVLDASGDVDVKAADLTHDGVPVGKTHKHDEVVHGSGISGKPIP